MINLANTSLYWPMLYSSDRYTATRIKATSFTCGYCSNKVSSDNGYPLYSERLDSSQNHSKAGINGGVYICPQCLNPTFLYDANQVPGPIIGNEVEHLPEGLAEIYDEIRKNISGTCYTSAVLLSRKLLMHIAVEQGADKKLKFIQYVNYLVDKGFTPPNSKPWVDSIRQKGNEATHEIKIMVEKDATHLLIFLEMILKFLYSFPMMMEE